MIKPHYFEIFPLIIVETSRVKIVLSSSILLDNKITSIPSAEKYCQWMKRFVRQNFYVIFYLQTFKDL